MLRFARFMIPCVVALAATTAFAADDAKALYEHGCGRKAAALCEQRLAANPADVPAQALLSRLRAEGGNLAEAEKLALAAVAADPKNADAQYSLAETYGREAQNAGMLKAAGYAGKMKKAAEAALAIDPGHLDALDILVDFYTMAPGFMGGDKKKAAVYTERIAEADPVAGWLRKGQNAMRDKDTTLAGQCYSKALDANPQSGRAQVQLAAWLAQSWRDPARAEKLALQATAAEPWRPGGWQVLAALYANQSRWTDLEDVLRRSEAAEPAHLGAWYVAGRQLVVDRREPARAEGYLRHYLSREPEIGAQSWAAARWRLALALEQEGKKQDAITELQAALQLDPKLDDARKDLKRMRG